MASVMIASKKTKLGEAVKGDRQTQLWLDLEGEVTRRARSVAGSPELPTSGGCGGCGGDGCGGVAEGTLVQLAALHACADWDTCDQTPGL